VNFDGQITNVMNGSLCFTDASNPKLLALKQFLALSFRVDLISIVLFYSAIYVLKDDFGKDVCQHF
jgi:hypothetical protein